jgi:alkanesulfonate monooxygenase SsuD/methylene tetrahydromethanopterin reductase-like flavin-dependent oxidoreductase (luciferase family)
LTDYGHDIQFGAAVLPLATPAHYAVQFARLAESEGYDLITVQDHPYQSTFLDAWTLLTTIAAATTRVHVSPNVGNLPLRPPAVLARSAITLDLLSEGRAELGLGAGAFWDAIDALGGRRLTPGQAVTALSEAIDVIRGIWDADNRHPLRIDGEFYHIHGAARGPRPEHDIGIWLGAYKPRMLALTGTKADGWLPSTTYLQPGDLRRGNTAIDRAAETAGRDPKQIRRLLNIVGNLDSRPSAPAEQVDSGVLSGPITWWIDALSSLALNQGIGTFILSIEDPEFMSTFGRHIAPAVRANVEAARSSR